MRILFISHDASRTGAPIILLKTLQWLKKHKSHVHLDVLLLAGGDLEHDFKSVCNHVYHLHVPSSKNIIKRILNKIVKVLGFPKERPQLKLLKTIAKRDYQLIYANSIVSVPVGIQLKLVSKKSKLLVHVHELQTVIKQQVPNFGDYISEIDTIIAASIMVKENLISSWKVDETRIQVIYEFSNLISSQENVDVVVPNKKFIVGASGGLHWRKAYDLFIQTALIIKTKYSTAKIEFIWIGGKNNFIMEIINADIEKAGLTHMVKFIGLKKNPFPVYSTFDVFLLPSREDPFPLVCIEAAMLGKPLICFEKATGIAEILENGGGFIVPYLDTQAMAEKVMFYFNNKNKAIEDGKNAQALFSIFTPEKMCPKIYGVIEKLLN